MVSLAAALALLAANPPAAPIADGARPALAACLASGEAARGVTVAMKACAAAEYRRRDATLNRRYRALLGTLPAHRRDTLRQAQRRWIRTRDAACLPLMGPDTGSLGGLDYLDCMSERTSARSRQLAAGG